MNINASNINNGTIVLNGFVAIRIDDIALWFCGHQKILTPIG